MTAVTGVVPETTAADLSADLYDASGTVIGSVELPEELFGVTPNLPLMHQVVVAQLAAARHGTHNTKTRGEVRGGGKKPYRQKGTGRARQGSTRAPQFTGGGVVHGPKPRDYAQRTPKKMIAAALRGALSDRAAHRRVHLVTGFVSGEVPSTKEAKAVLAAVSERRKLLVVLDRSDAVTWKSLSNLADVHLLDPGQLNTYDVLISDDVVFVKAAFDRLVAERTGQEPADVVEVEEIEAAEVEADEVADGTDDEENEA